MSTESLGYAVKISQRFFRVSVSLERLDIIQNLIYVRNWPLLCSLSFLLWIFMKTHEVFQFLDLLWVQIIQLQVFVETIYS